MRYKSIEREEALKHLLAANTLTISVIRGLSASCILTRNSMASFALRNNGCSSLSNFWWGTLVCSSAGCSSRTGGLASWGSSVWPTVRMNSLMVKLMRLTPVVMSTMSLILTNTVSPMRSLSVYSSGTSIRISEGKLGLLYFMAQK